MSYKLSEVTGNIFDVVNWERLLKFGVVSIVTGLVTSLVIVIILFILATDDTIINISVVIVISLVGNIVLLSWYEHWRGCNISTSS